MGICLGYELHTSGRSQLLETVQNFRSIGLELLYHRARYREGHLEFLAAGRYHVQQKPIHGQVASVGHTAQNRPVGEIIVIVPVVSYIEEAVLSEPVRLMHLKIYAD